MRTISWFKRYYRQIFIVSGCIIVASLFLNFLFSQMSSNSIGELLGQKNPARVKVQGLIDYVEGIDVKKLCVAPDFITSTTDYNASGVYVIKDEENLAQKLIDSAAQSEIRLTAGSSTDLWERSLDRNDIYLSSNNLDNLSKDVYRLMVIVRRGDSVVQNPCHLGDIDMPDGSALLEYRVEVKL